MPAKTNLVLSIALVGASAVAVFSTVKWIEMASAASKSEQQLSAITESRWTQTRVAQPRNGMRRVERGSMEAKLEATGDSACATTLRVSERSEEKWTRVVQFNVSSASFLDDGTLVCVGYGDPMLRMPPDFLPPYARVCLAVFDRNGNLIIDEITERTVSAGHSRLGTPSVLALFPGASESSFIVCFHSALVTDRGFRLQVYSTRLGKSVAEYSGSSLAGADSGRIRARGIYKLSGAPLYLVDWFRVDTVAPGESPAGSEIAVYDEKFRHLWSVYLRGDYANVGSDRGAAEEYGELSTMEFNALYSGESRTFVTVTLRDDLETTHAHFPLRAARTLPDKPEFFVYSIKQAERTKFVATRSDSGAWSFHREFVEPNGCEDCYENR